MQNGVRKFNNFVKRVSSFSLAVMMTFVSSGMSESMFVHAENTQSVDEVHVGVETYNDVDILLTQGETDLDLSNFERDVRYGLTNKGLADDKIHIQASDSKNTDVKGEFAWDYYSHLTSTGESDDYQASSPLTGNRYSPLRNGRAGTIEVQNCGTYSNVCFTGNWVRQGSAFCIAPVPDVQPGYVINEQTTEFDYSLGFGDSITSAGYIISAEKSGNYLEAYVLAITNSATNGVQNDWSSRALYDGYTSRGVNTYTGKNAGSKYGAIFKVRYDLRYDRIVQGYKLKAIGNGAANNGLHGYYYQLISSFNLANSGHLKIVNKNNKVNIIYSASKGAGESYIASNLSVPNGSYFGYFMETYDHGCSSTGSYLLKNLSVTTNSRIPYNKVLTSGTSVLQNGHLHFIVNVDDKVDNSLSSATVASLTDSDKGYDGLHFIGWGNSTNKNNMTNFLREHAVVTDAQIPSSKIDYNNGPYYYDSYGNLRRWRGKFLNQSSGYAKLVQDTVDYIYNLVMEYAEKDYVIKENPATLVVDPNSMRYNSSTGEGQYKYGKWTVKHYSKTYDGNVPFNQSLYGGQTLIEADLDGSGNVIPHVSKTSKYATQTFDGHVYAIMGVHDVDAQIYMDENGTTFTHDLDTGNYIDTTTGKVGYPQGELVGTIPTGSHTKKELAGVATNGSLSSYDKVETKDSAGNYIGNTGDAATNFQQNFESVGQYIVFRNWGLDSYMSPYNSLSFSDGTSITVKRVRAYEATKTLTPKYQNWNHNWMKWWLGDFSGATGNVTYSGELNLVKKSFDITPVAGDNTKSGEEYVFYVLADEYDSGSFSMGQFKVSGVGDAAGYDNNDTGYQAYKVVTLYRYKHYTSEPVYSDAIEYEYDPIIKKDVPLYDYIDTELTYDDSLLLYKFDDEVGLYEIYYEDQLLKTVYEHRRPVANFRLGLTTDSNLNRHITYNNLSYDLDHYYSDYVMDGSTKLNGIKSFMWEYKRDDDTSYTLGKLNVAEFGHEYVVRLTVTDREGERATYSQVIGDGTSNLLPPIAIFELTGSDLYVDADTNKKTIPLDSTIQYADSSYDPNGLPLVKYHWSLSYRADNDMNATTIVADSPTFPYGFSKGVGSYVYTLKVENSKGLVSEIASDSVYVTPAKRTVTYDKNNDVARQYGATSVVMTRKNYTDATEVDTTINSKYCVRLGWSFLGWGASNNTHDVYYNENYLNNPKLYLGDKDITVYAVYNRSLTLRLEKDDIAGIPAKEYHKTIWNHDTNFYFAESEIGTGTTRNTITYTVNFADNGPSNTVSTGHTSTSTEYANGKIETYRYFDGWYTTASDQFRSVKIGETDTDVQITPYKDSANNYNVMGNFGNGDANSTNNKITLVPQYKQATIKLPNSSRHEDRHGVNGTDEDKFLGWFTNPQPADGGSGDGGVYVGKPGDIVTITSNMTLYPWFNVAPEVTHSVIQDGFFEGQPISYAQLLTLVDASDDDDASLHAVDGDINWGGVKSWIDMYSLNADMFISRAYPTMTEAEKNAILSTINYADFKPYISGITYYRDGKDAAGNACSDSVETVHQAAAVESEGLATSTDNIGKVVIHYQISDNGTLSNGRLLYLSPITVNFDLVTTIAWNNPPTLDLKSGYIYAYDPGLTADNIEEHLLAKQDAKDVQDDTSRVPWWYVENTAPALDNTLHVVSVYDIVFQGQYELDHPDRCAEIKQITDIKELFKLKDDGDKAFTYITNFKVEMDCNDQWGKSSKEMPLGMSKTDRSIEVINFSNEQDYDLAMSAITENMRYISDDFMHTLLSNQYWGDDAFGKNALLHTFEKYVLKDSLNPTVYTGKIKNSTPLDGDRVINITVNDYSDN